LISDGKHVCVECGAETNQDAEGWRMYHADDELGTSFRPIAPDSAAGNPRAGGWYPREAWSPALVVPAGDH
jgi:hypothetical protein